MKHVWHNSMLLEWIGPGREPFGLADTFRAVYANPNGELIDCAAPDGMTTDGASIPWVAQLFIGNPFGGRYLPAAMLHDAAYANVLSVSVDGQPRSLRRQDADWMFLELMRACGVARWRRWAMYAAVRLFGSSWWAKHHKEAGK